MTARVGDRISVESERVGVKRPGGPDPRGERSVVRYALPGALRRRRTRARSTRAPAAPRSSLPSRRATPRGGYSPARRSPQATDRERHDPDEVPRPGRRVRGEVRERDRRGEDTSARSAPASFACRVLVRPSSTSMQPTPLGMRPHRRDRRSDDALSRRTVAIDVGMMRQAEHARRERVERDRAEERPVRGRASLPIEPDHRPMNCWCAVPPQADDREAQDEAELARRQIREGRAQLRRS